DLNSLGLDLADDLGYRRTGLPDRQDQRLDLLDPGHLRVLGDDLRGAFVDVFGDCGAHGERYPVRAELVLERTGTADLQQSALVNDRDPVAGPVGLLEVLRGQQDG